DLGRTVDVPFLGRRAGLLPGAVTLAQVTGAPLLMVFMYRTPDYRHQVLEISAPVPMAGDTPTAFARCADVVSAAIRRSPAHWAYWASGGDLARIGVLKTDADRSPAAEPTPAPPVEPTVEPTLLADREFAHDGPADNVAARG
ncbi:MAG TPA: hypothetical protein VN897_04310, partial [Mycobacterium sp.]|nr:hypothetical protein [Mycobacterium sp.]